ncbi:MAG: hypothetical protein LBU76_08395 [Azoarcus sp.]|jgi:hypothetical protein|nr:hypothetical protein [Azoarcus sp.]
MNPAADLHIFRAGRHAPMSGGQIDFSEADLAACAAAYDPALHEAPIVVGHPATNGPAYGWVKNLSADGSGLHASPHQVDPAFAEIVAAGRYKKISASFYLPSSPSNPKPGVLYLRHMGFLGAQPPAVKGLRQPAFGEAEEGVVTVSVEAPEPSFCEEAAEPNDATSHHLNEADATKTVDVDRFEKPDATFCEESAVTPEQAATLEAENARLKQELENLNAAREAEALARRHDGNAAFAEKMLAEARIGANDKPLVVSFLDLAGGAGAAAEFGEGGQSVPLDAAFRQFLAARPPMVAFGEHATKDKVAGAASDAAVREFAEKPVDPERLTLHARAHALAAEKSIPYGAAIRQVIQSQSN